MYNIWYLISSDCDCIERGDYATKPDWVILLTIDSQCPVSYLLQNAKSHEHQK